MNITIKPLGSIFIVAMFFLTCQFPNFSNDNQDKPDTFLKDLLENSQNKYTLTGTIDTLDSLPITHVNNNDNWNYHQYTYKYYGGYSDFETTQYDLKVIDITDSIVIFNCYNVNITYYYFGGNQKDTVYKLNDTQYYTPKPWPGIPLLLNSFNYSRVIRMDDGSYTFRAVFKYTWTNSSKIINSRYGDLCEEWSEGSGAFDSRGGYFVLIKRNGVDFNAGKMLNEYYIKDSILNINN
jgi:hypothetical protein